MKKLNKKGIAPLLIFWVVAGVASLVAGGYFLSQANKTVDTVGGGWLGIPIFGWIVIILLLLVVLRSRR